jgi:iron complex transport system ATP-binding protein
LLQVADVHFGYASRGRAAPGQAPLVLDGVTMNVPSGGLVGILGPNGSGKTTLLRLIAGVIRPDTGQVSLDGDDVLTIPRRTLARRLAVVPQETQLAFDYSALEIVLMGRYPHLGAFEMEGPDDLTIARSALEATGTAELAERAFRTLSGGEKQRVVIASALAQLAAAGTKHPAPSTPHSHPAPRTPHPALLLLDEPTASLDLRYQLEIGALLRRLHADRDVTIVLSTHDLRFASAVCDEVVLLRRGRVLAQGAPAAVLSAERVGELYDIDAALAAPLVGR